MPPTGGTSVSIHSAPNPAKPTFSWDTSVFSLPSSKAFCHFLVTSSRTRTLVEVHLNWVLTLLGGNRGVFGEEGMGTERDLLWSPRPLGPTLVEMSLEMNEGKAKTFCCC